MTPSDLTRYFAGLSHTPDRRAAQELVDLDARLSRITAHAETLSAQPGARPVSAAHLSRIHDRHREKTLAYWAAEGRCMSAMIVGPANFPTARNAKRLRVADKRREAVAQHLQTALKQVELIAFPDGQPGDPIRGNDPEAIEKIRAKIEQTRSDWETARKASALTRADRWDDLAALLSPQAAAQAKARKAQGVGGWNLASYSAEVKRLQARLDELEAKRARGDVEEPFEGGTLRENVEADRIQLLFDDKPSAEVRALLKSKGFRFAPSQGGAWQRVLNNAGRAAARAVIAAITSEG